MIKEKYKKIILEAAYFSPIIILIPRLFYCNWYDSLILGSTILCGLAAVGAVILGVLFYQDYGSNKILDRKINTVNEFLERIRSISMDITCIDMNRPFDDQIVFWTRTTITKKSTLINSLVKIGIDPAKTSVIFEVNNYYDGLDELNKISNSVFMPPELQQSFDAIRPHVFWKVDKKSINPKLKITFNGKPKPENIDEWRIEKFSSFNDYFSSLQKIITDLEEWLNKNSNSPSNLNL
jgi:hypothetical protein